MPDTPTTWHDATSAAQQWSEPPQHADLVALLQAAREQCEAYAPALAEGESVPERYRLAQLFQAKALWQSQSTGVGDTIDAAGQTVRVYPMDWQVKQLLRPSAGVPVIG